MSARRSAHRETAVEREADRVVFGPWERQAIALVPVFLTGLAANVIGDVASALVIIVASGVIGTGLTLGVVYFFHQHRWPRRNAYATALFLFIAVALVPIIILGETIGPSIGRLLR